MPASPTMPPESEGSMATDVLLYDGHCRFCSKSARSMLKWAPGTLTMTSFRDEGVVERYGLTFAACEEALHLVRADGRIDAGILAVAYALRHRWFGPLLALVRLPGIFWVASRLYRIIGRYRFRIAGRECTDGGCSIYQR